MLKHYQRKQILRAVFLLAGATLVAPPPTNAKEHFFSKLPPPLPPVLTNPSACGIGLPINDNSCNANHRFSIDVQNAPGASLGGDVFLKEIRFIIRHEWVADLDMQLVSPSGVVVELTTDNGSGNDNYGNPFLAGCGEYTALLSPAAAAACNAPGISSGVAPFIGSYLPEGNLGNFNDGSDPNGLWVFQICDDGTSHYGTLEFVELVFEATSCMPPTDIEVEQVDSTTVMLNWTPGSNCNGTIIEYGAPGFSPGMYFSGSGTVVQADCPPYILTGLTPSSDFELTIREFCGGFNFSANACPVSFSTTCSPPPVTLAEDFDNQALCEGTCGVPCEIAGVWKNALNDDFDWTVNAGPTSTAQTGPDDDLPGGGNYIYIETSGSLCRNGNEAMLVSNCILVNDRPDSCDLSFNYHLYGVHSGRIQLHVSLDGGITWQLLWQVIGNLGDKWHKKFIDLAAYDGMTVQFRFTGRGGSGIRGDLALDNLVFYGSQDLGEGTHLYYVDNDGDGFGQDGVAFATCQAANFNGYVSNRDDCDDNNAGMNPAASESPCDGIDLNCNGMDDEFFLLPPIAIGDTVCSGFPALVTATPSHNGTIFWYETSAGGAPVSSGNAFSPSNLPLNLTAEPVTHVFFAEEISPDGCISTARTEVQIVVNPQPDISTDDAPAACAGKIFDLASLNVTDANSANGSLAYFTAFPFIPANEISPMVQPLNSTIYYLVSTANGGCIDIFALNYTVLPSPTAEIFGDLEICRNGEGTIFGSDTGNGVLPLIFAWNNGSTDNSVPVAADPSGAANLYAVTITGNNGCVSADSAFVQTVTSVDAVQVSVQAVTVCDGTNGAVTLLPLDGMAPFTYSWSGGATIANQPGGFTFSNLTQGAYAFTVTDDSPQGCEFVLPVVVVNGPSAVVTLDDVDDVRCHGGSDGCIEINVLGNNPLISWSNGATTGEVNCGLSAGTYSVTITEGNCSNVLNIPVGEPESLVAFPDIQPVSCEGGSDGTLSLNVFGGSPPYQFFWENGVQTSGIFNLAAGMYDATVTDSKGCQMLLTDLEVPQPAALSLVVSAWQPITCFGYHDGLIFVDPQGGTPPFNYAWNTGGIGNGIKNLPSDFYTVSITDGHGCQFNQTFFMPEPPPVSIQTQSSNAPACDGIADGSIAIFANGGSGGYQFSWSNGAVSEDISGLPSGGYVVTVTDQLGCVGVSDSIFITAPETLHFSVETSDPTCFGIDNGTVEALVGGGGTPPYQFSWSTDESGAALFDLPGGDYTVTVTDANGCLSEKTVTLNVNQPMSTVINFIEPACYGSASGQISLNVSGSIQPHDISWSTGQHGSSIAGLTAANYTATITDAIGCQLMLDLIELHEPPALKIETDAVESIACNGGSEGSLDIHPEGGTAPYQFLWSNGETTEDLGNLTAGFYRVTITDAHNCVTIGEPLQVLSPALIVPVANLVAPLECTAVEVDSVCVSVTGGIAPYQFLWSNDDADACLVGVPSGDYTVTITDAAGCTTELMSVKVPDEISPISLSQVASGNQLLCSGSADGDLRVAVEGGTKPYQFIWSNGEMGMTNADTLILGGLTEDAYNVTITDNLGCVTVSDSMQVLEYSPLLANAPGDEVQHVSCKSGQNGTIQLNVYGGTTPYFYTWLNANNNVVSNAEDPENLLAGTYHLLLSDGLGCTTTLAAIVVEEPPMHLSILMPPPIIGQVSCFGFADGEINVTPSGGTPPYLFAWNDGVSTEDRHDLLPGTYTLTITDSHLCGLISQPFFISTPESAIGIADLVVEEVTCFGGSDGVVDIDFFGGTPPYFYNWNLPSMEEDLVSVPAGTYELVVLDANFCIFERTVVVGQPDEILIALTVSPATYGSANGSATATASGGIAPYEYQWSNFQDGQTVTGLLPGWYEVTVTDAHFCTKTEWVEVSNTTGTTENQPFGKFEIFPNPTSGEVSLRFQNAAVAPILIRLTNATGQRVFEERRSLPSAGTLGLDWRELPSGVYQLMIFEEGRVIFCGKVVVARMP